MTPVVFLTYTFLSGAEPLGVTKELQKVVNPLGHPLDVMVSFVMNCLERDTRYRVCIPVVMKITKARRQIDD